MVTMSKKKAIPPNLFYPLVEIQGLKLDPTGGEFLSTLVRRKTQKQSTFSRR